MEEFRDIPGYEGLYQVSNMGNVKSLPREARCNRGTRMIKERILKHRMNGNGYLSAYLSIDGIQKTRTIHQLVAITFLNHKSCGYELVIDHINDNPSDNRLENLQIVTQRFNSRKTQGRYTSKYKGVCWYNRDKRWKSQITINNKEIYLGLFKCELAASVAYQKALEDLNNGKEITIHHASFSSKYKGVYWNKNAKKWGAYIKLDKKQYSLGVFEKEFDAHIAYQKALEDFNNGKEIERNIRINSSKYKGVCWDKRAKKWKSKIEINGKRIHLGYFEKEFDAHVAYQNKLLSLNN